MTKATDKALFNQNKRLLKANMPDESICPYCNAVMIKNSKSPYNLVSIDHIQAYTKGGSDDLSNLIACCANCNSRKGNSDHMVVFKLKVPKILHERDYILLNDYLDVSTRIFTLRLVKDLLEKNDFKSALSLSKESQKNTTSKGFFSRLNLMLEDIYQGSEDIKEKSFQAQASVVIRIKAELDKMKNLEEKTKALNFVTYSLIS